MHTVPFSKVKNLKSAHAGEHICQYNLSVIGQYLLIILGLNEIHLNCMIWIKNSNLDQTYWFYINCNNEKYECVMKCVCPTIFLPEPAEEAHPAKQGDTYVIPFPPHTGSHSLLEHKQPELQSERREGSWAEKPSSLHATTWRQCIYYRQLV